MYLLIASPQYKYQSIDDDIINAEYKLCLLA